MGSLFVLRQLTGEARRRIINTMIFLPIVERHLRVLSRKGSTYWSRTGVALAFTTLAMFILWEERWRTTADIGRELFTMLGGVGFSVVLLGGVGVADSISSEKREGTLGLMFLTDLNGFDIVLGKLAANGVEGLYVLCAALPVLCLPALMGGVTGSQLWQMGLVILNSMFFALCAGLFVSSISRSTRMAVLGTLTLVGFLTLGILGLEALWHELTDQPYPEPVFARIGPLIGLIAAFAPPGMPDASVFYWQSVISTHVLAWGFLLAAARIVPHVWQDKGLTVRGQRWRERLVRWSVGHAAGRKVYRSAMLERNPLCWLDDRYRLQKSLLWAALLAAISLGAWLFSLYPTDCLDDDVVIPTVLTVQGVLLVWLAFAATHRLAEDKRNGALELLLATPISVREILRGRLLALRRQFGWVFAVATVGMGLLFAGMIWLKCYLFWRLEAAAFLTALGIAGLTVFLLDSLAIAVAGQMFALRTRNSVMATLQTLIAVVGVHWGLVCATFMVAIYLNLKGIATFTEWHALMVWSGIGVVNSLFWTGWTWGKLNVHFRRWTSETALQTPLWKRVARRLGCANKFLS